MAPRTVVMASGAGTNFAHVLQCIANGTFDLDLRLLVCNKPAAPAIEKARAAGVPSALVAWERERETRAAYDARLLSAVAAADPEAILLLGWMHVLAADFFDRFAALINIHPAYLPLDPHADTVEMPDGSTMAAFRGARALDDAIAARARWTGATCHLVTPEIDRGPVLARAPMPLFASDTRESAYERLRPLEHQVLTRGICRWLAER